MPKHIVILSSLDTKGDEARFLKDLIEARGFKTLLLDTSIGTKRSSQPRRASADLRRPRAWQAWRGERATETGR
jgi:uncharacterized protein (UPF0261 family)